MSSEKEREPSEPGGSVVAAKATDDPAKRQAHRLTVLAFEQQVKPELRDGGKGAFPAAMNLIERVLKSGVPVAAVECAITAGVEVWTLAGLQTAVARAKPRNGDPLSHRAPEDTLGNAWNTLGAVEMGGR